MNWIQWFFDLWSPKPIVKPIPQVPISALRSSIVAKINVERNRVKLKMFNIDQGLMREAQMHSVDMATELRIDHDGFEGRINAVHPNTAGAENVGLVQQAGEIVDLWMKSAGHRANILGNYDLIGVGIELGTDNNYYITGLFDYV